MFIKKIKITNYVHIWNNQLYFMAGNHTFILFHCIMGYKKI